MKKLLAAILSASSFAAIAANNSDLNPVYINLNTGLGTNYGFTANGSNGQSTGATNNNYSLGANIGYNFNRNFAIEVGYNQLFLPVSGNNNGQVGVEDVAVKGEIPLGDVFSLYGRVGVAGYQGSGGNFANNMGALYGLGGEWALSKNWALRTEYWSVTGLNQNIIQFGAQFSF